MITRLRVTPPRNTAMTLTSIVEDQELRTCRRRPRRVHVWPKGTPRSATAASASVGTPHIGGAIHVSHRRGHPRRSPPPHDEALWPEDHQDHEEQAEDEQAVELQVAKDLRQRHDERRPDHDPEQVAHAPDDDHGEDVDGLGEEEVGWEDRGLTA